MREHVHALPGQRSACMCTLLLGSVSKETPRICKQVLTSSFFGCETTITKVNINCSLLCSSFLNLCNVKENVEEGH